VNDRTGVAGIVLGLLVSACPRLSRTGLRDETRLDHAGLGLDSIEIVEVLLGCEEHYGASAESLLEGGPLTFGRVVDHFAAA
jgi:acyl carrier protein